MAQPVLLKQIDVQPRTTFSELQVERLKFKPPVPSVLALPPSSVGFSEKAMKVEANAELAELFKFTYGKPRVELSGSDKQAFEVRPVRVGVVLSGGQAPGGHNVVSGERDSSVSVPATTLLKRVYHDTYQDYTTV